MTRFNFEDFCLDTQLYELRLGERAVPMEPQVFDVLLQLVVNHERVMTKDELMEKVWGDKYISEAALNSRIMSARKAIGDTGREQRLIRTVHGRGYRFLGSVTVEEEGEGAAAGAAGSPARASGPRIAEDDAPLMLGRDQELAFLDTALQGALEGKRQVVFITGEAGLGKTTLVNAFLRSLDHEGLRTARGHCLEQWSEGEPYMPVLEALGRLCEGPAGQQVLELLGRHAPTWLAQLPGLVPEDAWPALQQRIVGTSRDRMLREIGECLDAVASAAPLILLLEDLHWSDHSTLALLDLLARRSDPARLLVVATFRPTDIQERHPLYSLARELTLRGLADEIRLGSLPETAVDAFAESRLGKTLEPAAASALMKRTGGNPLYMEMVLDAVRSSPAATTGTAETVELFNAVPETLRSYVEQRMSLLHAEERAALEAASVGGSRFSAAAVGVTSGMGVEVFEDTCNALARVGRFIRRDGPTEWPDGSGSESYSFMHDLYPEVLYQSLSSARRTRMHQEIGTELERLYAHAAPEHATELALHFLRGRVTDKAIGYLRAAGEQALSRSADREAGEHLRLALQLLSQMPDSRDRQAQEVILRLELASALVPRHGWLDEEMEHNYKQALDLARALGEEEYLSAALFANATMYEVRGEYEHAGDLMNERVGLPLLSSPQAPLESCELLACSEFHRGMFQEAQTHAEQGVELYRDNVHGGFATLGESPGVGCYDWSGLSSWFLGEAGRSLARVKEALEIADLPGNSYSHTLARTQAAVLYQLRGEAERTKEWAEAAIAAAKESGYAHRVAWGGILLGWARTILGEPERGIREIRDGMKSSLQVGARMDHPYHAALLADAYRSARMTEAGLEAVDNALGSISEGRDFFFQAEILRLKGLLLLQKATDESQKQAMACFEEALEVARKQGARPLQLRAAMELVRHTNGPAEQEKAQEVLQELTTLFEGSDMPELKDALALLTE